MVNLHVDSFSVHLMSFPLIGTAVYPFVIIKLSHEFDYMLGPVGPSSGALNVGGCETLKHVDTGFKIQFSELMLLLLLGLIQVSHEFKNIRFIFYPEVVSIFFIEQFFGVCISSYCWMSYLQKKNFLHNCRMLV